MLIIYPKDTYKNAPDDFFADEVAHLGGWRNIEVGWYDFDPDARRKFGFGEPNQTLTGKKVLYRGWMLSLSNYSAFVHDVEEAGGIPIVSSHQYANAHSARGWLNGYGFDKLKAPTALASAEELTPALLDRFGCDVVLKSYYKSPVDGPFVVRSGDNFEKKIRLFKSLSDTAGCVISQFEEYEEVEYRIFWINCWNSLVVPHPTRVPQDFVIKETPLGRFYGPFSEEISKHDSSGNFYRKLSQAVSSFGHPFITTDVAVRKNGEGLRLIEVGDGQVSGIRPTDSSMNAFKRIVSSVKPYK